MARYLWVIGILLISASAVLIFAPRYATSWHFFSDAAHALLQPKRTGPEGGLDVYVSHPEFQFGPISILAAAPFAFLPDDVTYWALFSFTLALGVVALIALDDAVRSRGNSVDRRYYQRAYVVGGGISAIAWTDVAVRTAHIDDAVALACACLALAMALRNKAWATTVLLAVAAAAKPWAIVFIPLALVPVGPRRWTRLVAISIAVAATWLPFVLDSHGTIAAVRGFQISNASASALRVLGFESAAPLWVRPAQIGFGFVLGALAVRAGRPHAVVMAGLGVRLMLDPGVHHYYTAGLVLGVLMWELGRRPDRLPWATAVTAVALEMSSSALHPAELAGALRLLVTAAVVVAACVMGDPVAVPATPVHASVAGSMGDP